MLSTMAPTLAISALLFAGSASAVAPPKQPGPWRQLGKSVTAESGKLGHFFRLAKSPTALAIVAVSSSARPIRLTWFSYCEFESDDAMTEEHQAAVVGVRVISVTPPVLDGATLCTVSVTMRVGRGRTTAAIFDY